MQARGSPEAGQGRAGGSPGAIPRQAKVSIRSECQNHVFSLYSGAPHIPPGQLFLGVIAFLNHCFLARLLLRARVCVFADSFDLMDLCLGVA